MARRASNAPSETLSSKMRTADSMVLQTAAPLNRTPASLRHLRRLVAAWSRTMKSALKANATKLSDAARAIVFACSLT